MAGRRAGEKGSYARPSQIQNAEDQFQDDGVLAQIIRGYPVQHRDELVVQALHVDRGQFGPVASRRVGHLRIKTERGNNETFRNGRRKFVLTSSTCRVVLMPTFWQLLATRRSRYLTSASHVAFAMLSDTLDTSTESWFLGLSSPFWKKIDSSQCPRRRSPSGCSPG